MVLLRNAEGNRSVFCTTRHTFLAGRLHVFIRESENYAFTFYAARPIITMTGVDSLEAFLCALFGRFFIDGQKLAGTAASGMGCGLCQSGS